MLDISCLFSAFPEIPEFVDEFTGHVTAADCACHVWVVRRDSNTLIASKLTSSVHTDVADRIELVILPQLGQAVYMSIIMIVDWDIIDLIELSNKNAHRCNSCNN